MKKNMGATDKTIRVLIAIVIAILYFTDVISGTLAIILGIIAIVFVITSLFSFCPAYVPLKMSTAKKETK
jgi:Inner membrane protein YgaP-like, transmembrane domain